MKSFTGVVISDLHAGDRLGPLEPHFETLDRETVEPNSVQKALNQAYEETVQAWKNPDVLISLGDAIGGQDRHGGGVSAWSTNILDQIKCAKNLLEKFHARKTYVIRGSGYHVTVGNTGLPAEEILAEQLHAEPIGVGNYRSAIKFMLDKYGVRVHFAHHVPTSQVEWYLTTPIAKEGIRIALQEGRLGKVHAIFRGHNHYYVKVEFWNQILVSCPCWVLPSEWMHKKSGEPVTTIGAVRFRITEEADDFGKQIRVQKRIYPIKEANTRVVSL
jgi:hypothetical protein